MADIGLSKSVKDDFGGGELFADLVRKIVRCDMVSLPLMTEAEEVAKDIVLSKSVFGRIFEEFARSN